MKLSTPNPNLPIPAFLAEIESRRKAAEQKKQEERDRLTIYLDGQGVESPAMALHRAAMSGNFRGRWTALGQREREEAEAARKAKREGNELVFAPEPIFDPPEEY